VPERQKMINNVAYIQSDEMTILLNNNKGDRSTPFLANRTQKIASLVASTASVAFNKALRNFSMDPQAVFDARVYVVPLHEMNNVFIWRQQDCKRNGIHSYVYHGLKDMYGRKTAQKMLHQKNLKDQIDLIEEELGVPFSDIPIKYLRGRTIWKKNKQVKLQEVLSPEKLKQLIEEENIDDLEREVTRSFWFIDEELADFKGGHYITKRYS